MKSIMDLKNERKALWEQAKAFDEKNRDPRTGLVNATAVEQYDRMVAQIRQLANEIARREKQEEMDREIYGGNAAPDAKGMQPAIMLDHSMQRGDDAAGNAFASASYTNAFRNLRPVMLHEAAMYMNKMDTYGVDDLLQECQIVAWEIIARGSFKGGVFSSYYGAAIRNHLIRIWRDYNLKNLVCIGESEDCRGNITRILVRRTSVQIAERMYNHFQNARNAGSVLMPVVWHGGTVIKIQ